MAMRVVATEGDVQIKDGDSLIPLTAGQAIDPGDQLVIGEDASIVVKEDDGDLLFLYGGDLVVEDQFGESEAVNVEDLPFTTQPEAELVSIFDVNANLVLGKVFAGWNSIILERPVEETKEEEERDNDNTIIDPAELSGPFIINGEGYEDLLPYNNLAGGLPGIGNILVPIQLNIQFSVGHCQV
ncbi:MAG: hypothetical protein GY821_10435 [Gammaproteobacteria bacterium]|nr:hypothetical protein [Gammaproteobacteria bacterium]